jgi:hypothetical protein
MAPKRSFQSATQRRSVQRCNHRHCARFQAIHHLRQPWVCRGASKLADVSSGYESATGTMQDDGCASLLFRMIHRLYELAANRLGQRIHRRVVDCDKGNARLDFAAYGTRHF